MTYRLLLRRRARNDIDAAARWYELKRKGLGREFVGEVDRVLMSAAARPLQYQLLHRDARRAIVRRFPFGVFY